MLGLGSVLHLSQSADWVRSEDSEGRGVIRHSGPLVLELTPKDWADLYVIMQLCANAKAGVIIIETFSLCLNGGQSIACQPGGCEAANLALFTASWLLQPAWASEVCQRACVPLPVGERP